MGKKKHEKNKHIKEKEESTERKRQKTVGKRKNEDE